MVGYASCEGMCFYTVEVRRIARGLLCKLPSGAEVNSSFLEFSPPPLGDTETYQGLSTACWEMNSNVGLVHETGIGIRAKTASCCGWSPGTFRGLISAYMVTGGSKFKLEPRLILKPIWS